MEDEGIPAFHGEPPETNSIFASCGDLRRDRRFRLQPYASSFGLSIFGRGLLAPPVRSPVWDVSAERQVEIDGPRASRLIQLTTPRDLSRMQNDQCCYIPVVDDRGRLLNDPVLVRLAATQFGVSLADSDLLLFDKRLAGGLGLKVSVFEPDVSPLVVQGPLADELIGSVFGEATGKLRHFRHRRVSVAGTDMVIARSGWSHQGGFQIYLKASENGEALWDLLFEAGQDLDIRAGCPNYIERISCG